MAKEKSKSKKKPMVSAKSMIKKAAPKKASSPAKKKSKVSKNSTLGKATPKKKAAKKGKRKPETLMCFLTTACVDYYSLPDNGYELTTLRNYRDGYLSASKGGEKLIQEYYKVSPEIVKRVNKDEDKRNIYEYIYTEVKSACEKIQKQKFLIAKQVYIQMVKTLMNRYHLV